MERTKPKKKFLGKTFLNNLDAFSLSRVLFMIGAIHKVKKNHIAYYYTVYNK